MNIEDVSTSIVWDKKKFKKWQKKIERGEVQTTGSYALCRYFFGLQVTIFHFSSTMVDVEIKLYIL